MAHHHPKKQRSEVDFLNSSNKYFFDESFFSNHSFSLVYAPFKSWIYAPYGVYLNLYFLSFKNSDNDTIRHTDPSKSDLQTLSTHRPALENGADTQGRLPASAEGRGTALLQLPAPAQRARAQAPPTLGRACGWLVAPQGRNCKFPLPPLSGGSAGPGGPEFPWGLERRARCMTCLALLPSRAGPCGVCCARCGDCRCRRRRRAHATARRCPEDGKGPDAGRLDQEVRKHARR